MAKYNYDKAALKGLDTGAFMDQVKVRQQHIEAAPADLPTSVYNPNKLAQSLHPDHLVGRIKRAERQGMLMIYEIEPLKEAGFTTFPNFRAGQYISIEIDMGDSFTYRAYALCSSPKSAMDPHNSTYEIMVGDRGPGHASEYIFNNWKVGTVICFSAPVGKVYYEPLRDSRKVVAIGFTVTHFLSMARAINDGIDDYELTILYVGMPGNFPEEMQEAVAASKGKVKLVRSFVPGLFGTPAVIEGMQPISPELIGNLSQGDTTYFINCPITPVLMQLMGIMKQLHVPARRIKVEEPGEIPDITLLPDFPKDVVGKSFNLRIWARGEYKDITCSSQQPLIRAIHEAGFHVSTDCRSGSCGWCHSRLIKGGYYMPKSRDGRRAADRKFGWIHPCCTYPLSDMEIEVFPNY